MTAATSNSYLRNAILQANPEQLQLMLYDGAIRYALKGREAIEKKDYEGVYLSLSRAQKIVLEMEAGLRPEVNRELCVQLAGLYDFVYRKLIDGCVHRDVSAVDDALKILRHQRETWVILLDKVTKARAELEKEAGGSADPSNAAGGSRSEALCVEG